MYRYQSLFCNTEQQPRDPARRLVYDIVETLLQSSVSSLFLLTVSLPLAIGSTVCGLQ
jgi:hypothetical protein